MSNTGAGETYVAELLAGVSLDASGLEMGASRAERAYRRMLDSFQQQKAKYEQTGREIDRLGARLDDLHLKYKQLSPAEQFGFKGAELQAEIRRLIPISDALVEQYTKQGEALKKTALKLEELGYQVEETAKKEEAAAQKRMANQSYAQTTLQITAVSSALSLLRSQFGEAGDFISAIIQYLVVYRQQLQLAKMATDAMAAAEATKNAQMTMGLSILVMVIAKAVEYIGNMETAAKKAKELRKEYEQTIESLEESRAASEVEIAVLDPLIDRYDELNGKASLTAQEKNELAAVVGQLQQVYADLDWQLDETTGRWNIQTNAIRLNKEEMLANIEAQYIYSKAVEAYTAQQKILEDNNYQSKEELEQAVTDAKRVADSAYTQQGSWGIWDRPSGGTSVGEPVGEPVPIGYVYEYQDLQKLLDEYNEYQTDLDRWTDRIKTSTTLTKSADTGATSRTKATEEAAADAEEAAKKAAEEAAKVAEEQAKELLSSFETMADSLVTALQNKYQAMLDAETATLEASAEAWQQWADSNTAAIQAEIDKLDELEQQEQAEQKAAELKQKADELAYQLRFETDEYTRRELEKAYNAAKNDYQAELLSQERQAQKQSLQAQLAEVQATAQQRQEELQAQQQDMESRYALQMEEAQLQQEAAALIASGREAEVRSLLETYDPDYFQFGQSFGEQLASGMSQELMNGLLTSLRAYARTALTSAAQTVRQTAASVQNTTNKSVTIGEVSIVADTSDPNAVRNSMNDFAEYLADLLK